MTTGRGAVAFLAIIVTACVRPPQRHAIDIRDLAFLPGAIEVAVGDTLVWTNHDLFPHTATVRGSAGWDTGQIPADSTRRAVARRAGEYQYVCELHPTMRGKVIVR